MIAWCNAMASHAALQYSADEVEQMIDSMHRQLSRCCDAQSQSPKDLPVVHASGGLCEARNCPLWACTHCDACQRRRCVRHLHRRNFALQSIGAYWLCAECAAKE